VITWEQAQGTEEELSPPRYDWELSLPALLVAIRGLPEFV
jgi:hypothetical protein